MSIETKVICEGCGESVKPPMNRGWLAVMVTAPDGANFADCLAHLCDSCKADFRQWLAKQREAADAKKRGRPS